MQFPPNLFSKSSVPEGSVSFFSGIRDSSVPRLVLFHVFSSSETISDLSGSFSFVLCVRPHAVSIPVVNKIKIKGMIFLNIELISKSNPKSPDVRNSRRRIFCGFREYISMNIRYLCEGAGIAYDFFLLPV